MPALKDPRQEAFCHGVAKGLRKGVAYRQAGYKGDYGVARTSSISQRPHILKRIDELIALGADHAQVTIDKVVRELALIAFSNPSDFVGDDDQPLALHQLTRDQAAAVQTVDVIEQYDGKGRVSSRRFKYRLHDKRAALETLGKHLGLFGPDFSVNTTVVVNQQADADKDREELKRIFTRLIDVRKADEAAGIFRDSTGNVITDPERLKIEQDIYALKMGPPASERPPPLRLVSPPVEDKPRETPSPPVEDKPLSTTEAYLAWINKPRNPFE